MLPLHVLLLSRHQPPLWFTLNKNREELEDKKNYEVQFKLFFFTFIEERAGGTRMITEVSVEEIEKRFYYFKKLSDWKCRRFKFEVMSIFHHGFHTLNPVRWTGNICGAPDDGFAPRDDKVYLALNHIIRLSTAFSSESRLCH